MALQANFTWYTDSSGKTPASAPAGIAPSVTAVNNSASTVTMAATTSAVAGSYYFAATFGSTSSAVATMTVASPPLTVYTGGCNGSAYGYWYGTSGSTPSWVSCPSGNENVNSIAVSGSTVYVGGVAAAGRGYWYGTAGSTPTWVSCPSGSEDVNSIAVSGSTVYIPAPTVRLPDTGMA